MEQIKALLDIMSEDAAFREEVNVFIQEKNTADIISTAAKKGINFTETDWQAYLDWSNAVVGDGKSELPESELEDVAGGHGEPGSRVSGECWFFPTGNAEFRDGDMRKKCGQFSCKAIPIGKLFEITWYQCKCHGLDWKCKNSWHVTNYPPC